jgi:hypothetical protein
MFQYRYFNFHIFPIFAAPNKITVHTLCLICIFEQYDLLKNAVFTPTFTEVLV